MVAPGQGSELTLAFSRTARVDLGLASVVSGPGQLNLMISQLGPPKTSNDV